LGQYSLWAVEYEDGGMAKSNFPSLPAFPPQGRENSCSGASRLIARTGFAISNEESRYTLTAP